MKTDPVLLNRSSGKWSRLYAVESSSRPGMIYYVGRSDHEEWACSCPAWIYHTPRRDCKHIRDVQANLARPIAQAPAQVSRLQAQAEEMFDRQPNRAKFIEL